MNKQFDFQIAGMQKDISPSSFKNTFAYDIRNMRLTASEDQTYSDLINEKGTLQYPINGIGDSLTGVPIGQSVIDDKLIVFTVGDKSNRNINIDPKSTESPDIDPSSGIGNININDYGSDKIYKLWFTDNILNGEVLYSGDLGFNYKYPIETLNFYETEDLEKVYWIDNLNPLRVINVAEIDEEKYKWTEDSFNFIPKLSMKEDITITKSFNTGMFDSGTIQYVITYLHKYAQESAFLYYSPLYYISFADRGASPTNKVTTSFKIELDNLDSNYDYVSIYSLQHTSIDTTPVCRHVTNIPIPASKYVYFVDTGTIGDTIAYTDLLYKIGEEVSANAIGQKANTLFIGNYKILSRSLDDYKSTFYHGTVRYSDTEKTLKTPDQGPVYPYVGHLNYSSNEILTFKYKEWYRFGLQFQYQTGKWADPIWINDVQNNKSVKTELKDGALEKLITASYTFSDATVIQEIIDKGYLRVRPVIVYPSINDMEVLCQGVVCPTVYNVKDRFENAPFAQSSWFIRPNAPTQGLVPKASIRSYGQAAEFRHNRPIPGNDQYNGEIQCIWSPPETSYYTSTMSKTVDEYVKSIKEDFYVDQSTFTFHSPDIEFNPDVVNIDLSAYKFRIVGAVPITATQSYVDVNTSTTTLPFSTEDTECYESPAGFYSYDILTKNQYSDQSKEAWREFINLPLWFDESYYNTEKATTETGPQPNGFVVYPWQRNGSLNNTQSLTSDDQKNGALKTAMLSQKKISNLRYSAETLYFDDGYTWNAQNETQYQTGISGAKIFSSDEMTMIKLPKQLNCPGAYDTTYYGNVEKVLLFTKDPDNENRKKGYPLIGVQTRPFKTEDDDIVNGVYTNVLSNYLDNLENTEKHYGTDPVAMKYKSNIHAVMALNYSTDNVQVVLPTLESPTKGTLNSATISGSTAFVPFWNTQANNMVHQDAIYPFSTKETLIENYGWLWMGELYNDTITTAERFGGQTEEAFANNNWLPCGDAINLLSGTDAITSFTLKWDEGDTYYQRYDNIKTKPFTTSDQNQNTEVCSFMCETHINLDGRYDRNRGLKNNTNISETNFNLVNTVYSQKNNYFTYHSNNDELRTYDEFRNQITWSTSKVIGDLTDAWTSLTLANTLDLDGNKGDITSIKLLNNNLLAIQEKGISQILYNENVQVSSEAGIPIEIANSGKVQGYRLINDIGCSNKWAMCSSINSLFFIDDINKGLYMFSSEGMKSLSDSQGFRTYMVKNLQDFSIWNPVDFSNYVMYYDTYNNDVLIINDTECLSYNSLISQFSSFYSYENTPYVSNLSNHTLMLHSLNNGRDYKVWGEREGSYNYFFKSYQPYGLTFIANPKADQRNPLQTGTAGCADNIFNTLTFCATSTDTDNNLLKTTFDRLTSWNEHQRGTESLVNISGVPSSLKQKFRIWRANIPRSNKNNMDRMRSPWLYLELKKEKENADKNILHSFSINYFN